MGEEFLSGKGSRKVKGMVYFLLGLNSRDFMKGKKFEPYLKRSLFFFRGYKRRAYKVHVELAEHFYNSKKFKKALYHYSEVLRMKNSRWFYRLLNST